MSEERFDCIVVGGGLAGLTAAYVLANAGKEVMLVERGNYCGSKNVTGGRIYGHSMEKVIPEFAKKAPVERKVVKERLLSVTDGIFSTKEFDSCDPQIPGGESYTVLRSKFDRWLAEQAEEAGVMLISDILVEDLLVEEGRVCGIVASGEVMEADIVILAEGVNGLLAQKIGLKAPNEPGRVSVGVKEVIGLNKDVIQERFGLNEGEGMAWMINGLEGVCDAFLYTNGESISAGISMQVSRINQTEKSVPQMLEDFLEHPEIAPLLEGGTLLEYSAHLFPEGSAQTIGPLYGDGVLIAGDAAGLCVNFGDTLRGMDLAVESGRLAAETAISALDQGEFTREILAGYQKALEASSVYAILTSGEGK
ncbi:MAG: FAD-dependent oxidoreductase [Clostridium sp.]|nr:FAD-dependent oxidoreductase [Clostridium sp.]